MLGKSTPFEEQETIISFAPKQICGTAEVYTCMPNVMKKLRKQAEARPDCVRITKDLGDALFADVDQSCIKITPKRIMSEEQRMVRVAHLRKGVKQE